MLSTKLAAGELFPEIIVNADENAPVNISRPKSEYDWQMILVYRGRHCPLCTKYLNELEHYLGRLNKLKIGLAVVSADTKEQSVDHLRKLRITYPLYYGLTLEQMKLLGLYISYPRSPEETDHLFPEPGLFIINESNQIQFIDISNTPFARPDLEGLVKGLEYIREKKYPIRGTYPNKLSKG